MPDDSHLLGNDVDLFADFGTDLDQRRAVMGTETLGFRQLVPHDLAFQCRIRACCQDRSSSGHYGSG
jgi:hypothetical protein